MTKPLIRLVLAISIDGRIAPPLGGKAHLGNEGDREVLEEALTWSDATLMGAGSLRAHQSTCLIKKPSFIKDRLSKGKSKQPISIIVSNKIIYSAKWLFFQQPITRWLITNENDSNKLSAFKGYERLINANKWEEALENIYTLGIKKIALLGGAILAESFLKEDLIDELQLTIVPKILGGENTLIKSSSNYLNKNLDQDNAWVLNEYKVLSNNEIMIKYYRNNLNTHN